MEKELDILIGSMEVEPLSKLGDFVIQMGVHEKDNLSTVKFVRFYNHEMRSHETIREAAYRFYRAGNTVKIA